MANILVVDDDDAVRALVCDVLRLDGHEVVEERDGQALMDRLGLTPGKERSLKPDLIVLDVMMPKVDGFTAHGHLQNDAVTRRIPVLILTSKAGMKDPFALSSNVGEFMAKPFKPAELQATVKRLLAAKGKA